MGIQIAYTYIALYPKRTRYGKLISQTSDALYPNRAITDLAVSNGGQCAATRCGHVGARLDAKTGGEKKGILE